MRMKIRLDTANDAAKLVTIAEQIPEEIHLTDGRGMRVSAKSLLGALCAAFDFTEIYLESDNNFYFYFRNFEVVE